MNTHLLATIFIAVIFDVCSASYSTVRNKNVRGRKLGKHGGRRQQEMSLAECYKKVDIRERVWIEQFGGSPTMDEPWDSESPEPTGELASCLFELAGWESYFADKTVDFTALELQYDQAEAQEEILEETGSDTAPQVDPSTSTNSSTSSGDEMAVSINATQADGTNLTLAECYKKVDIREEVWITQFNGSATMDEPWDVEPRASSSEPEWTGEMAACMSELAGWESFFADKNISFIELELQYDRNEAVEEALEDTVDANDTLVEDISSPQPGQGDSIVPDSPGDEGLTLVQCDKKVDVRELVWIEQFGGSPTMDEPWDLEESESDGDDGDLGELEACMRELSAWNGYFADKDVDFSIVEDEYVYEEGVLVKKKATAESSAFLLGSVGAVAVVTGMGIFFAMSLA